MWKIVKKQTRCCYRIFQFLHIYSWTSFENFLSGSLPIKIWKSVALISPALLDFGMNICFLSIIMAQHQLQFRQKKEVLTLNYSRVISSIEVQNKLRQGYYIERN